MQCICHNILIHVGEVLHSLFFKLEAYAHAAKNVTGI